MDFGISDDPQAKIRIDKWLWAARFYKTRSLAAHAVTQGRVRIGGDPVKPAREVRVGEKVTMQLDGIERETVVKAIAQTRGPATVARQLYEETQESQARRAAEMDRRKLFKEPAAALPGRPTKRTRRVIDKLGTSH
ncbi:MAG: RNA-binding S4 domain-containing protein [Janthinobacterium lividum]